MFWSRHSRLYINHILQFNFKSKMRGLGDVLGFCAYKLGVTTKELAKLGEDKVG